MCVPVIVKALSFGEVMEEIMREASKPPTPIPPTPTSPAGYVDTSTGKLYVAVHEPMHRHTPGVNLYPVDGLYVRIQRGKEKKNVRIVVEKDKVYLSDGIGAGYFTILGHTIEDRFYATPPNGTFRYKNLTFRRLTDDEARTYVVGKVFAYRDVISEQISGDIE